MPGADDEIGIESIDAARQPCCPDATEAPGDPEGVEGVGREAATPRGPSNRIFGAVGGVGADDGQSSDGQSAEPGNSWRRANDSTLSRPRRWRNSDRRSALCYLQV